MPHESPHAVNGPKDTPGEFIIPTKYRSELASGTSHPFGAKRLTEALRGVPQLELFELCFTGAENAAALSAPGPHLVVEITYLRRPPSYSSPQVARSWLALDPIWEIRISPLRSAFRKKFSEYLEATGFALMRAWLLDSWKFHGEYGRADLRIEIDGATGEATSSTGSSIQPAR